LSAKNKQPKTFTTFGDLETANFVPRNKAQAEAYPRLQSADITIISGPAGTGKSHLAVASALDGLKSGKPKKIILSRPVTPFGEDLGFQPGDVREKMQPWLGPIRDVLGNMAFESSIERIMGSSEIIPIAFVQGRNFQSCTAILDEGQNCTYAQLEMFATRLADNGKIIITGCPEQSANGCGGDFRRFIEALRPLDGVAVIEFTDKDIVRHPRLAAIIEALRANCPINPTIAPRSRRRRTSND
jgi:phosphate starvation-inducible PhoH-like protein